MELIVVSIISGIFSVIAICLLNHNWFKRQHMKYSHEEGMYKLRKQYAKPKEPASTPLESASSIDLPGILNLVKGLDADQIGGLLDLLQGGEMPSAVPEGLEGVLSDLIQNNPELVQSFLKGVKGGSKESTETAFTE